MKDELRAKVDAGRRGVTLVELLLYVSLMAVMLLGVSILLAVLLSSRVKNQTIAEVEQQGVQVLKTITNTIRNSENIISPLGGTSAASLVLDMLDATKDPTTFDLSASTVRITEGASSPLPLTGARLIASGLEFQNLSRPATPGTVRIKFTLAHINPETKNEFEYSKTFHASASLRK